MKRDAAARHEVIGLSVLHNAFVKSAASCDPWQTASESSRQASSLERGERLQADRALVSPQSRAARPCSPAGVAGAPPVRLRGLLGTIFVALVGLLALVAAPALASPLATVGSIPFDGAFGTTGGRFEFGPQGLAVNQPGGAPGDGDIYALDVSRVQQFDADGNFIRAWGYNVIQDGAPGDVDVNEQVKVALSGTPAGGTFTVFLLGAGTAPIPYDAPATGPGSVQDAFENHPELEPGDVVVSGPAGGPWTIEFTGAQADTNEPELFVDSSELTGSEVGVRATVLFNGEGAFEKCTVAADCRGGEADPNGGGLRFPRAIAFDQASGAVFVDGGTRVVQFDSDGDFQRTFGWDVVEAGVPGDLGENAYEICTVAVACQSGTLGANGGEFGESISGLAVDPRNGDVLAFDKANARIQRFNADGSFDKAIGWDVVPGGEEKLESCTSTLPGACQAAPPIKVEEVELPEYPGGKFSHFAGPMAVDSTGSFYVADVGAVSGGLPHPRVQKFTPEGTAAVDYVPGELSPTFEWANRYADRAVTALAVDPANDHLYAVRVRSDQTEGEHLPTPEGNDVVELDSTGSVVDVHARDTTNEPAGAIALSGEGRFYLAKYDGLTGRILIVDTPQPPEAVLLPASEVTKTSAKLNAEVDPNGFETGYRFEYRRVGSIAWKRAPAVDDPAGSGSSAVPASQTISNLQAGAVYEVRIVATKRYGGGVDIDAGTVKTLADQPRVSGAAAFQIGGAAKLVGLVDPSGLPTSYHFEYGTADCASSSCTSVPVPEGDAGESANWTRVHEVVDGLSAGVLYHFRLVATNAEGTVEGPDTLFELGAAVSSGPQRAYEQVSPSDKNGYDAGIGLLGGVEGSNGGHGEGPSLASPGGDAIVFTAVGPLADTPLGCSALCDYRSFRADDGWHTNAVRPRPTDENPTAYSFTSNLLSSDLTRIAATTNRPVNPGDPVGGGAIGGYVGAVGSSWSLLPGSALPAGASQTLENAAASDSLGQVAYDSEEVLTGDGQPSSGTKTYVYDEGTLRLASILPDDSFAPSSKLGSFSTLFPHGTKANAVSDDGRYVFFSSPTDFSGIGGFFGPPANIYRRDLETNTTTLVSPSKRSTPDEEWFRMYEFATPDGKAVVFSSFSKLTDASTASLDFSFASAGELYRYDIPSDTLVDLSVDHDGDDGMGGQVSGFVGASDDARYVYYVAMGEVVEGGTPGQPNLYVWHDDGTADGETQFVTSLDSQDSDDWATGPNRASGFRTSDVAGSGRVVFESVLDLTGNDDEEVTHVYTYDPHADGGNGQILCVSCRPDGEPASTSANLPSSVFRGLGAPTRLVAGEGVSTLTEDGRHIYFESTEPLVPEDVNGKVDVYEWSDGEVALVSTGTDAGDSQFMGAGDSGRDVFFRTRQKLVPTDGDTLYDVYDARRGGGFAISKLPPCAGEECRPEPQDRPTVDVPASGSFAGDGNLSEKPKSRRCRRGKALVRRGGKVRCVKKHHRRHRRSARSNQGGGR